MVLADDAAAIRVQDVRKEIELRVGSESFGVEAVLRVQVGEQNAAATVGYDQRPVERVQ